MLITHVDTNLAWYLWLAKSCSSEFLYCIRSVACGALCSNRKGKILSAGLLQVEEFQLPWSKCKLVNGVINAMIDEVDPSYCG